MADRIESTIDAIHAGAHGHLDWSSILEKTAKTARVERMTLLIFDPENGVLQQTWPFDPEGLHLYATTYAPFDVRIERALSRPSMQIISTPNLMSPAEIAQCPFHQEFVRIYPDSWHMTGLSMRSGRILAAPLMHSSARHGPPDEEQTKFLSIIGPHLVSAYQFRTATAALPPKASPFEDAFDAMADGMVVFDMSGSIVTLNPAARTLIEADGTLRLVGRTLSCEDRASRERLALLMGAVLRFQAGQTFTLPRPILVKRASGAMPLKISAFASPGANRAQPYGVLTIRDMAKARLPSADMIRQVTPLSNAEAKLCEALLVGTSMSAYADANGLSEHTVRTQFKDARAKLNASNQAEAMVTLMRLCGS
ncbi:DNA-binding transcriptional regulator, CsgD family [Fulvimarina manganoxydans]|uniref:DNA-binding transcriptional regulator, CsgD family n=1 Tax=Fulvimarina manganoxydans TaxID=937218 RepID=A0A1W2AIM7_9HYPH|nr:helix-turn-helix transcriptional regulator [Fulvimarina manganoxydans]SMC60555.1 DNA-binding transcriptional regulator, CsgD family [Fulvimarina manganoxydans]